MANTYFQFKQFIVYHDKCGMKISTDSCLFGAWVADFFRGKNIAHILDIGTGTGLLTLMLAQKTKADITAVEIDGDAYLQAKDNLQNSPFSERIRILHQDAKKLVLDHRYDLVICNPPFFLNDLKPKDFKNQLARHEDAYRLEDLMRFANKFLTEADYLAVLLPYHRKQNLVNQANKYELEVLKLLSVQHTLTHPPTRLMAILGKKGNYKGGYEEEVMQIKSNGGCYSPMFTRLLKDYYLHL